MRMESRMEKTRVLMMKATKMAMRAVMERKAMARKKKPRRRKRKKRVAREAPGQRRQRQNPSRRTRKPRRVRALEGLPVDVDAARSMYYTAALIPTDGRLCWSYLGAFTIMETICLKAYCDGQYSQGNFTHTLHKCIGLTTSRYISIAIGSLMSFEGTEGIGQKVIVQ